MNTYRVGSMVVSRIDRSSIRIAHPGPWPGASKSMACHSSLVTRHSSLPLRFPQQDFGWYVQSTREIANHRDAKASLTGQYL